MKILFVFGGKQKGGAERVITNLANDMIDEHEVYFLGLKEIDSFYKFDKRIKYYFVENKNLKKENFIIRNIRRTMSLAKKIKTINPDIIISFAREQSYRILFTNYFNKRKIILSVRNDPSHEYTNIIQKIAMRILYVRVNGFVFQTTEAQQFFSKNIQKKSIIIPNPINEKYIVSNRSKNREKIIITAGRLVEQKNHILLLNAFAKIKDDFKDYNLIIYGKGELKEDLEVKIRELGLEKRVILAGEVDDLKDKIRNASLFVLPSLYEGMPNSLIEAMALGIPAISTDCPCGGPRFLIKNNYNGILVPINNPDSMADAMKDLLSNQDKADDIGKNAMKIVDKLNPKKINNMWINYINEITRK